MFVLRWSAGNAMATIYFPNAGVLKRALCEGIIPANVANSGLHFVADDEGGLWLEPNTTLPREVWNSLRKLGARKQEPIRSQSETLLCWAQALSLERGELIGPGLFELTELRSLPWLMAELNRLSRSQTDWHIAADGIAWVRTGEPPIATLFRSEVDEQVRVYIEQSPGVWIQRGWRHPLPRPYLPPANSLMLIKSDRDWRLIADWPGHRSVERYPIKIELANSANEVGAIHVPVQPRLVADRENGIAELWVLNDEAKLVKWLGHADDRLIGRVDVARVSFNGANRVVIMSRGGRCEPPVLVLDAESYRPYQKLPNLFVPLGQRLTPPLRRDLAKKAIATESDRLYWLDNDGRLKAIPMSAFRRLSDCVRHMPPSANELHPVETAPMATLDRYEIKDRSAGERIHLLQGESTSHGRLAMIWRDGQWRLSDRDVP
jgi:hypothetical protein